MRPRNPRFASICDQFSFFITHHIPSPLLSGFEYPLHHRLCRNWLLPTTVCGPALLCLECVRIPVPPSLGWLLFILPDWGHHFEKVSFIHRYMPPAEPYFCKQSDDDIRVQPGIISGSPQNCNLFFIYFFSKLQFKILPMWWVASQDSFPIGTPNCC